MNVKKQTVATQNVYEAPSDFDDDDFGSEKSVVVGSRFTAQTAIAIDELPAAEKLKRTDYVRRAMKLKSMYPGEEYLKLMAHAEAVIFDVSFTAARQNISSQQTDYCFPTGGSNGCQKNPSVKAQGKAIGALIKTISHLFLPTWRFLK